MSITPFNQDTICPASHMVWGRLFGSCIEETLIACDRSVDQAAHLAGMETSEWLSVEAGLVPDPAQTSDVRCAWASLRKDRLACVYLPGVLETVNLLCCRPGALLGRWRQTLKTHILTLREGGGSNQEKGRNGSQTNERQCPNRSSQQLQGRSRSARP